MTKKTMLTSAAALVVVSGLLAACGSNAGSTKEPNAGAAGTANNAAPAKPAAKDVTLNFVYAGGDPATKQAISDTVTAFTTANPNIKINQQPSGSGPYPEFLKTKDAVGEFPDIVEMRDTQLYVNAGKIAELPASLQSLIDNPPQVSGKVYTAPMSGTFPQGIIYNKKIFQQAGITSDPKTYAEFLEDCDKIKKLGISPIVVGGKDVWHMGFWINFFLEDQVFIQNPNWNGDKTAGKTHFADANVTKAMQDFTALFTKGYVDNGWLSTPDNQTAAVLTSGKAAMLFSGPWMFSTILQADPNFQLGFFALPDAQGQIVVNGLPSPQGLAISAEAAKNPDKAAAFEAFVKFFYSKDQYPKFLKAISGLPVTKEKVTYEASDSLKKVLDVMNDPKTKKSLMINNWWGDNQIPPQFRDWFYKLSQQWISTGKPSVEEAMKQADQEWDKQVQAVKK